MLTTAMINIFHVRRWGTLLSDVKNLCFLEYVWNAGCAQNVPIISLQEMTR